jgi:hypothetical protein
MAVRPGRVVTASFILENIKGMASHFGTRRLASAILEISNPFYTQ